MDVILKADVDSLGLRGEVVHVARGYARNFLLPRGLAEVATPALVREIEKRDAHVRRQEAKSVEDARAIASRVEALELRFDVNAGPTGTLFGSVTATNVADRLWELEKIRVDRRKLAMETIKRAGRYTVPVELFADVHAELRVAVAPEGEEPPEHEPEPEVVAEAPPAAAVTDVIAEEEPEAAGEDFDDDDVGAIDDAGAIDPQAADADEASAEDA